LSLKRLDDAEQDSRKVFEWAPASAGAQTIAAVVRFRRFDFEAGLPFAERAFALRPEDEAKALVRMLSHVLQGPAWERAFSVETAHYNVRTDISDERCQQYAHLLESMRPVYAKALGIEPPRDVKKRLALVLVFDTQIGFFAYAAMGNHSVTEKTLGFYAPSFHQLLLFEDVKDKSGEETLDTLSHEGFHQWADGVLVNLPIWANEGLAEYFGATKLDLNDGSVLRAGGVQTGRLANLRSYLTENTKYWGFETFMNESHARFMEDEPPFRYAQAWSMAHFFMEGDNGQHRPVFQRYLLLLKEGASPSSAFRRSFGRGDVRTLEKSWLRHVLALPLTEDG
jgi:hypothetical protein